MKKIMILLVLMWFSIAMLQGCAEVKVDTGETIGSPENNLIPIKGTWKIEKMKRVKNLVDGEAPSSPLLGKKAAFDKGIAILGGEACESPSYKIRSARARDYFLYTYQIHHKTIGTMDSMIEIVSITANDKHFYDVIRISDQQLVVHKEDAFFYLTRVSAEVDPRVMGRINEKSVRNDPEIRSIEPNLLRSGVLLGLRAPTNPNSPKTQGKNWEGGEEKYRTLWIAAKNRQLYPSLEMRSLLVPRKSGFWIVDVNRKKEGDFFQDHFIVYSMETGINRPNKTKSVSPPQDEDSYGTALVEKEFAKQQGNLLRRIRFIGNDYAAVEYSGSRMGTANQEIYLQLMPIDNIDNGKGIHISDIAGEEGVEILLNSAQGYASNLHGHEAVKLEDKVREDHFTLDRRNGHWIMKGRLYYSDRREEGRFLEYTINMIPPPKIVNYDELYISWNKIKERVPEAVDAFVSPNKDMAVIITENFIHVYALSKGEVAKKPMEKIKLLDGETVVMAEWATGNYVEKWKSLITERMLSKE